LVVSSLGNILIIEQKFRQEIDATEKIRKYEIPLIKIKKIEGLYYLLFLNQKKSIYKRTILKHENIIIYY